MNEIKCRIEKCVEVFLTEEAVSPDATFFCKNHPRAIQMRAVGRIYKPEADETDKEVHFQDHQFDKFLKGGTRLQKPKAPKIEEEVPDGMHIEEE